MIRNWLTTGISLSFLALTACDREDKSPLDAGAQAVTGSARIALPKVPSGYFADSGQKALFTLTISGPGMNPIHGSWTLSPNRTQPIIVGGIPNGMRSFQGRLFRIDSLGIDTVITHAGEDSAWIRGDSVTEVHLRLWAEGSGTARVCLEVDGWPSDSACIAPPPPPPFQSIFGCWALQVRKPGVGSGHDTLIDGELIIVERDSLYSAELTWSSGQVDSAKARYRRGEMSIYFGEGGNGSFTFKAHLDSAGILYGTFIGGAAGNGGTGRALRSVCRPDSGAKRSCFDFKQYRGDTSTVSGRLGIETHGDDADFHVHWSGHGSRLGRGKVARMSDTSMSLRWTVAPPPGVFAGFTGLDSASYEVQVSGTVGKGTILKAGGSGTVLGSWYGNSAPCISHDFRL